MPIYEYEAKDSKKCCDHCRESFELMQKISDAALTHCPECGAALIKLISTHSVGASQTGFDDRAKSAGFSKLKKTSKGEYEKQY